MTSGGFQHLALRRDTRRADEFFFFSRAPRAPLIRVSIFPVFHCRRTKTKSGLGETATPAGMKREESRLLPDV